MKVAKVRANNSVTTHTTEHCVHVEGRHTARARSDDYKSNSQRYATRRLLDSSLDQLSRDRRDVSPLRPNTSCPLISLAVTSREAIDYFIACTVWSIMPDLRDTLLTPENCAAARGEGLRGIARE